MEQKIFGDYRLDLPTTKQYITIVFAPLSLPVKWSNIGLSADFIGQYFEAYFPEKEVSDRDITTGHEIKHSISYIANELMENAVKFNQDKALEISLRVRLGFEELIFVACNSVATEKLPSFEKFIHDLISGDPGELLIRRIEENARAGSSSKASGLGLLTIMNDYKAKVGWKFEAIPGKSEVGVVYTMVRLGFST